MTSVAESVSLYLQVHYSNEPGVKGVIDSSGFKITYTPKLRNDNMGVMVTGHVMFQVRPDLMILTH